MEEDDRRKKDGRHGERENSRDDRLKEVKNSRQERSRARSPSDSESSDSSSGDDSSSSEERERREKRRKRRREREERRRKHRKERKEKKRRKDKGEDDDDGGKKEKRRRKRHKHDDDSSSSDGSSDVDKRRKKKLLKEAKAFLEEHEGKAGKHKKSKDAPEKIAVTVPQDKITAITEEDYFARNIEFSTWLREDRGVFFSSLTAEKSRELFATFVRVWNAGGLTLKFYEGHIKTAPRTGHNWAILGRGETAAALAAEEEERAQDARTMERRDHKRKQKEHDLVLNELVPKATGREAMLEKKAARRQQAKEREVSPEPMRERDIMGGGDDFQQRLARERAFRERKGREKQEVMAEKRVAYDEKEAAKMDHFRSLVGMAGGKITIPKRNDQPQPPA